MANPLSKITTRAKQIRKASPNKKWTDCIKQAAKEIKGGKSVSGTRKKSAPAKKAAVKKVAKVRSITKSKTVSFAGISGLAMSGFNKVVGDIERCEKHIANLNTRKQGTKGAERTALDREIRNGKTLLTTLRKQKVSLKKSL